VIVCSCTVITDGDIERAVAEIMSTRPALLPTPGVVFRHLSKRMNCCSCAPVAVAAIYAAMDRLQHDTRVCPYALAEARARLVRIEELRAAKRQRTAAAETRDKRVQSLRVALK
jgi:hypothetical protein